MQIIEINGVQYTPRQTESTPNKKYANSKMMSIMMMYGMFLAPMYKEGSGKKELNVDLVKEFELIQNKKSNLSKSERNWVEWKFRKTFAVVEDIFESDELCPHCDTEQKVTKPVQPCPNCGKELVACSMCKVIVYNTGFNCKDCKHGSRFEMCDFDKETGMIINND